MDLGHIPWSIYCAYTGYDMVTLVHEMGRRGLRLGLKAIFGVGGLGIAAIVERG